MPKQKTPDYNHSLCKASSRNSETKIFSFKLERSIRLALETKSFLLKCFFEGLYLARFVQLPSHVVERRIHSDTTHNGPNRTSKVLVSYQTGVQSDLDKPPHRPENCSIFSDYQKFEEQLLILIVLSRVVTLQKVSPRSLFFQSSSFMIRELTTWHEHRETKDLHVLQNLSLVFVKPPLKNKMATTAEKNSMHAKETTQSYGFSFS